MRRTSLDEFRNLWERPDGSDVPRGPRPPMAMKSKRYDVWHRAALAEANTRNYRLWQVHVAARTTFDDMVRLDLRYREVLPDSDLKILLQTPRAGIFGRRRVLTRTRSSHKCFWYYPEPPIPSAMYAQHKTRSPR